ncbi:MAG: FecR domain-containing protein [Treponema sp.]|nr:FecR domain-containing protein [Treponema sp.]
MKKIFLSLMILTVSFAAYSQTAVIREITGEVEIKPAGAASFTPARAGSQIARDTIISTGFRSSAVIEIGSNLITVRPLTRLTLSEIQSTAETENVNVNLQAGRIRVDVNPPAGTRANTTVQTPSATASVRGTGFEVDALNIQVFSGTVGWSGSNGLVVPVTSGNLNTVNAKGNVENPVEIITSGLLPRPPAGVGDSGVDITGTSSNGSLSSRTNVDVEIGVNW